MPFVGSIKNVGVSAKIIGVVFSDLGQGSSFMALDWVQAALQKSLGFAPFPATLNVRPKMQEDARVWDSVQKNFAGILLSPVDTGFCSARLYRVEVEGPSNSTNNKVSGAVLLPDVNGYPKDKIEIIAPVRLKSVLGVEDGDPVTLEFSN